MKQIISFILLINTAYSKESRIFMFLNKRPELPALTKEESEKIMSGHMANINKMAKDVHLLAAGPFEDGGGIFIFNAKSNDEVS